MGGGQRRGHPFSAPRELGDGLAFPCLRYTGVSVEDTGTAALQQEVRLAGLVFVCSAHTVYGASDGSFACWSGREVSGCSYVSTYVWRPRRRVARGGVHA